MSNPNIPFLDLVTPHQELKEELMAVVSHAFDTGGFIGGPNVSGFEQEFAKYCEAEHCVANGSGTDALRFAFIAAGITTGDVMITVPHTFIATTEAVSQSGAIPVFVDIEEKTYNMDPAKVREFIETQCDFDAAAKKLTYRKTGGQVKALLPVHIYGQMADMDALLEIGDQYGLMVFEDACQAHGAKYFSKKHNRWFTAGSMGKAAAFSFYPGKNLGACGEGGATTTNDADLAAKMRMIRDHGQAQKYYHDIEGYNGRLDAIQAGFLRIKLKRMPTWTEGRQAAAARYQELLSGKGLDVVLPYEGETSKAVYHLFVIRVKNREAFMKQLGDAGVGTGIHYPIPLHLQKAYAHMGYKKGDFPVTEKIAPEIVSLPMFPTLTAEQQSRVAEQVIDYACAKA
ncbi:MAG: DegT/DnrJ/EryC1/StrS family aminotransferase [Bryobacteraceae bacterium]